MWIEREGKAMEEEERRKKERLMITTSSNISTHLSPRGKICFPCSKSLTSFFLERAPGHMLVMPGITGISLALRGFLTRSKHRNSTRSGSPCSRHIAVNKRLESNGGEGKEVKKEGGGGGGERRKG